MTRPMSGDLAAWLTGSRSGDRMRADVYLDGRLVAAELPVVGGRYAADVDRKIHATLTLTVVDDSGELAPWTPDHVLGVAGSHVALTYVAASGEGVRIGRYRSVLSDPEETWNVRAQYLPGNNIPERFVTFSSKIELTCESLTCGLDLAEPPTPLPVRNPGSCLTEIRALASVNGGLPVTWGTDVVDQPVPAGLTHPDNRLDAIDALLGALGAHATVNPDGVLVIKNARTVPDPTFAVAPGDRGTLIRFKRSLDVRDHPNFIAITGKGADDKPLLGTAAITTGPMSIYGPMGLVVHTDSSDLLTTQTMVDDAARFRLNALNAGSVTRVPVTCLWSPAVELLDTVTVTLPGIDKPLIGQVMTVSWEWDAHRADTPTVMDLGLDIPTTDLWDLSPKVRALATGRS